MARMIPAFVLGSAPPGERSVHAALAGDDRTDDWTVLHSLGIADHVRQTEGEADFVIFVPGAGVLVVEVKSHRSLTVLDDGRWKLGSSEPTRRSPFQQANDAKHSIRKYLRDCGLDPSEMPVFSAVWFTAINAKSRIPTSGEWHRWQILDSADLANDPVVSIERVFECALEHLEDSASWFHRGSQVATEPTIKRAVASLRPQFEVHQSARARRDARSSELIRFIEEQFEALDAAEDNRSVVFSGPAGSGKTLLATESVAREVEKGHNGRLLCFNKLLGRRLAEDMATMSGTFVGTLHALLLKIADMTPPRDHRPDFWVRELPDRAADVLLASDEHVMDFLVLDEAQDLAVDRYLDLLDLLVADGLAGGRVLAFGDFNQVFDSDRGRYQLVKSRCEAFSYRLTTNCRNLPRIGTTVNRVSGPSPEYGKFRRPDNGIDPRFLVFNDQDLQEELLVQAIRELKDDGFGLEEITVLSPLRSSVAATATTEFLRRVLAPVSDDLPVGGRVQYATIQAFKGLESPAVILTDLDNTKVPNFNTLMYVAMTRATDRLTVIAPKSTLRQIVEARS